MDECSDTDPYERAMGLFGGRYRTKSARNCKRRTPRLRPKSYPGGADGGSFNIYNSPSS